MIKTTSLHETVDAIKEETDGNEITFGNLADILNSRGFGTLLIAPALIAILPTGAIPTIPTFCGFFIIFVCFQIVVGRSHPWLPSKLKNTSFDRGKFKMVADKIYPYLKKMDRFFKPRLVFLTESIAQYFIAFVCILLAISMSLVELIPFLAALPALAILFFGLGLSMRDGLIVLLGLGVVGVTVVVIYMMWGSLGF